MPPDSGVPHYRPATHRVDTSARDRLTAAIDAARADILARQRTDGCWQYELEADCTIPAEYILMLHYLGESDRLLESRLAEYLRSHQSRDGGWPLYPGGAIPAGGRTHRDNAASGCIRRGGGSRTQF